MNNSKTIVIVDNKRGPQGPTGGITKEAQEALTDVKNNVIIATNAANGAIESAANAASSAASAETSAELAAIFAEAAAVAATLFDEAIEYNPPDMVVVDGETYRCVTTSIGEYPPTSGKWLLLATVSTETFEVDINGDLMPLISPQNSTHWSVDDNGDIMPSA